MQEPHTRVDYPFAPIPEALLHDERVSGNAVRLYGVLARHGLDPASCYPSRKRLSSLMHVSESTVWRLVTELVDAGWVTLTDRHDESGRQLSNGYDLVSSARQRVASTRRGEGRADATGKRATPQRDSDSLRSSDSDRVDATLVLVDATSTEVELSWFDKFWSVYPRKVGKGAARKSFEKVERKCGRSSSLSVRDVCNAAWRFSQDPNLPELQFVPHPATWLNQERWEDGPLPARTDGRPPSRLQRTLQNAAEFIGGD